MADQTTEAIPVAVHRFIWTTALVGVLNLLVGGARVSWIRSRPKLKEIETTAEERLRADMVREPDKQRNEIKALTRKLLADYCELRRFPPC